MDKLDFGRHRCIDIRLSWFKTVQPFVQVTQETDADLPEVEPPRQRLATTKPRIETEVSVIETSSPEMIHRT